MKGITAGPPGYGRSRCTRLGYGNLSRGATIPSPSVDDNDPNGEVHMKKPHRLVAAGAATVTLSGMSLLGTGAAHGDVAAKPGHTADRSTAVPGIAPNDAPNNGTYLDQNGHVLDMKGTNAAASGADASARIGCTPVSGRDYPHYTAPDVSGHGWWGKGNCSSNTAHVFNCLYEYYTDGTWRRKACSPTKKLKPGKGGSAQRTSARHRCASTGRTISWRNHVDVDVDGEIDTGEKPYRQNNVNCVVN